MTARKGRKGHPYQWAFATSGQYAVQSQKVLFISGRPELNTRSGNSSIGTLLKRAVPFDTGHIYKLQIRAEERFRGCETGWFSRLSQHRGEPSSETAANTKLPRLGHLRELDGIRGIAALMVFFHHMCFIGIDPAGWNSGIVGSLYRMTSVWDTGVDVFFVLSGFLISSILIRDRESPAYYKDFYWKRALRIFPLYALTALGILIFIPGYGRFILLCAVFLANFANVFHITGIGPFWTLAIEEQFYLLWPTVVRRRSVASLRHWALAIIATVIVLRFAFAFLGHHNYRLTYLRCDGLALGALLACMLERCQRAGKDLTSRRGTLLGLLVAGLALLVAASFIPQGAHSIAFHSATEATGVTLFCGGFVGISIAYTGRRWLGILRSHVLTFFGLISYAFYMVHIFVIDTYDHFHGPLRPNDLVGYFVRIAAVMGITVAITLITRYTIELPIMSLRKYVLYRPTKPASAEHL
jgi:peptidoglycan/LPS O-acetylase OafA/YrhL